MEAASIQRSEQDLGLVSGGLLALMRNKTIDTLLYEHTNKETSALLSVFGVLYVLGSFLLAVVEDRSGGTK